MKMAIPLVVMMMASEIYPEMSRDLLTKFFFSALPEQPVGLEFQGNFDLTYPVVYSSS